MPEPRLCNTLQTIASWVEICNGKHHSHNCYQYRHPERPYSQPTRLLDVSFQPVGISKPFVRLVYPEDEAEYPYVTLSHRWGRPEPPRLCGSEPLKAQGMIWLHHLEAGIPISTLPRLFRDAIDIVQHCGIRYIWIDSLCIIQDRTPEGVNLDWEKETTKMGDIYAGGIL